MTLTDVPGSFDLGIPYLLKYAAPYLFYTTDAGVYALHCPLPGLS